MAGERILIVEDEARIAEVLERYLRADGYRVERAADGRRALELWRAAAPDLILLDLMIPEPDGAEVARRIRETSDVPIVMVTAKVEEADRLEGLGLGADDYVTKPFSPREVVARVRAVLRRSSGQVRTPRHLAVGSLEVDMDAAERPGTVPRPRPCRPPTSPRPGGGASAPGRCCGGAPPEPGRRPRA
ncbi:MAG: response regulator, partial [Longimicrobiales bacterium]